LKSHQKKKRIIISFSLKNKKKPTANKIHIQIKEPHSKVIRKMAKPLSDKSNLSEANKDAKEQAASNQVAEKVASSNTTESSSKPQKTKNKLINKLSLTGISSNNNNDSTGNDKQSNKENGKNGKKAVSAQNSQELGSADSPPPVQQKKKKLSFRQRLSRCGSGCKNKVTKKNSNEMEMENVNTSNNDLTNEQNNNTKDQQANSPKPTDDNNDVDINSPNASNAKAGNNQNNNQNVDANHCARNFFCWCCSCCSCLNSSNLTFDQNCKENSSLSINKQEHSSGDHPDFSGINDPPPTLEEIRAWADSFDKLIYCSWGRSVFRDFLKREYSEENILFWLACEDLKNEDTTIKIEEKARLIYEDFISILSPKEVSLDSKVREVINKNMLKPTKETFEEAQLQIYTLMKRDSYPRFLNSPMYRKLAQLPSPSRKNSVVVVTAATTNTVKDSVKD